jgi:hypothetical protein
MKSKIDLAFYQLVKTRTISVIPAAKRPNNKKLLMIAPPVRFLINIRIVMNPARAKYTQKYIISTTVDGNFGNLELI